MLEIRLSNVTKSYPKKGTKEKNEVLHGINAAFCGGKLYVIKGISGSGKTTLLNLIGGIDRKYEGEISYSEAGLKKASYVFQESLLLTGLTVRENLDLIFPGSSEIDPLAERLGVKDLLSRKTEGLSGGERQRIAILRALLQGASLILADEPTASLDGENSERVAELLNTLKAQERIILVATHEHYFDEMADSILYLKNGVIDRIEEKIPEGEAEGSSDRTDIGSGKQHGSPLKWISGIARNYSYIWKRRKKEFSLRAAFPIAVSLALLLVVSVIQRNLMSELVREYKSVYPMDMFETRPEKMKEFLAYPEVTPYYDYRIKGDSLGSYTYSLLPEEYSCFSLPKVIEYGSFPKEADEVIITPELAKKLGATDPKSFIGTEITFCGEQFRVSGILGGPDRIKPIFREGNYSMVKLAPEAAFALYDTVKEKGEVWHGAYDAPVKCIWPGLSESEERQEFVKNPPKFVCGGLGGWCSLFPSKTNKKKKNDFEKKSTRG